MKDTLRLTDISTAEGQMVSIDLKDIPDVEGLDLVKMPWRPVTDEQKAREKKENISRQTVEVADKVVEKQMRIVQEIASLLGETAAETKIALSKLKESISDE